MVQEIQNKQVYILSSQEPLGQYQPNFSTMHS